MNPLSDKLHHLLYVVSSRINRHWTHRTNRMHIDMAYVWWMLSGVMYALVLRHLFASHTVAEKLISIFLFFLFLAYDLMNIAFMKSRFISVICEWMNDPDTDVRPHVDYIWDTSRHLSEAAFKTFFLGLFFVVLFGLTGEAYFDVMSLGFVGGLLARIFLYGSFNAVHVSARAMVKVYS